MILPTKLLNIKKHLNHLIQVLSHVNLAAASTVLVRKTMRVKI